MVIRGWFQRSGSSFEFLLATGDLEERSGRNFLQSTFCFQQRLLLRKNKKIAILILIPTLNLTQALILALILTL